VFWGNEELRARQLAARDIFRETNGLAFFGYRTRRLVYNTNAVSPGALPRSLLELTNQSWHRRVALAYPQFGTTATHFHVLRQQWGDTVWQDWCRALVAGQPFVVDGNSVVVKMVARGEAWVGLTDSDDIAAAQSEGLPVAAGPTNQETLAIPNVVALVRGAPHPAAAQKLFDYLQQPAIAEKLVAAHALEGIATAGAGVPGMTADWTRLLGDLETTTEKLNQIFLR
jgi:iron(III) transport system substrate-binding protein